MKVIVRICDYLLTTFLLLGAAGANADGRDYHAKNLLGPNEIAGLGFALNNSGDAVGVSVAGSEELATMWSAGTVVNLGGGFATGTSSYAMGISDNGVVVGYSVDSITKYTLNPNYRPILWNKELAIDIGISTQPAAAYGVNNSGQIVGVSTIGSNLSGAGTYATFWSGGVISTSTFESSAVAINNSGIAVGNGPGGAGFWTSPSDFTVLPGIFYTFQNSGWGLAVSSSGTFAGTTYEGAASWESPSQQFAVFWKDGTEYRLPELGRWPVARGINNEGMVVGTFHVESGEPTAVLWDTKAGLSLDLNIYLSQQQISEGWHLYDAVAINDRGDILANAYNSSMYSSAPFLLTAPIPEPETYALMLAGLAVVGAAAKRKACRAQ
jgi:PEP-CTERM motif